MAARKEGEKTREIMCAPSYVDQTSWEARNPTEPPRRACACVWAGHNRPKAREDRLDRGNEACDERNLTCIGAEVLSRGDRRTVEKGMGKVEQVRAFLLGYLHEESFPVNL